MVAIEKKEVKDVLKSKLTAKESRVLKAVVGRRNPKIELEIKEQRRLLEEQKKLDQQRKFNERKLGILNLLNDRNRVIAAVNEVKKTTPISFGFLQKIWILDKSWNLNLDNFDFNANYSQVTISWIDSNKKSHEKIIGIPSNGNLSLPKLLTYLYNDARKNEHEINQWKMESMILDVVSDFNISSLSRKAQSWLKDNNYTSGSSLDFKSGSGSGIQVKNNAIILGNVATILNASQFIRGQKFDINAFRQSISKIFDSQADKYYQQDVIKKALSLKKLKSEIASSDSKAGIDTLESAISDARSIGILIPPQAQQILNEKKDLLKRVDNYSKENDRLNALYDMYSEKFDDSNFVFMQSARDRAAKRREDLQNIQQLNRLVVLLEKWKLLSSVDKNKSSKACFDALGKQLEYQAHVKKFKSLAQDMQI